MARAGVARARALMTEAEVPGQEAGRERGGAWDRGSVVRRVRRLRGRRVALDRVRDREAAAQARGAPAGPRACVRGSTRRDSTPLLRLPLPSFLPRAPPRISAMASTTSNLQVPLPCLPRQGARRGREARGGGRGGGKERPRPWRGAGAVPRPREGGRGERPPPLPASGGPGAHRSPETVIIILFHASRVRTAPGRAVPRRFNRCQGGWGERGAYEAAPRPRRRGVVPVLSSLRSELSGEWGRASSPGVWGIPGCSERSSRGSPNV